MARLGQFRRDTDVNWITADPIIEDGEFILVSTNPALPKFYDKYKIGNGLDTYSDLPFSSLGGGGGGEVDPEVLQSYLRKDIQDYAAEKITVYRDWEILRRF